MEMEEGRTGRRVSRRVVAFCPSEMSPPNVRENKPSSLLPARAASRLIESDSDPLMAPICRRFLFRFTAPHENEPAHRPPSTRKTPVDRSDFNLHSIRIFLRESAPHGIQPRVSGRARVSLNPMKNQLEARRSSRGEGGRGGRCLGRESGIISVGTHGLLATRRAEPRVKYG